MAREKIDPTKFIGHECNGIKILDIYQIPYAWWGAVVQCSCGRVFKMGLSKAKNLKECQHVFKPWRGKDD